MVKPPPPPIVAAALSGFVVGAILTLLITGTMAGGTTATPPVTLPPSQAVADADMYARVRKIVARQLGPAYPATRGPRLAALRLSPVRLPSLPPAAADSDTLFRSVDIVFRLNDHPLGRGWRLRAAKADVFEVLKALYTSKLPVYSVYMNGLFPVRTGTTMRDRSAVEVYIDYHKAATIPWKRWGRESESKLWNALTLRHVETWFA